MEQLLLKQLAPWLTQMQQDGVLKHWFFVRYGDPDWHLRLRCFGEPERLYGELLPALNRLLTPSLASAGLHCIELFTYMQETERYGGEHMMPLAEHFFCLDSQFVLQAILFSQQDDSLRWRLAILAIDLILTQFDYLPAEKFKLIDDLRTGFAQEIKKDYSNLSMTEKLLAVEHFISGVWQIHPFPEGNTRTIAVFTVLYLRTKGFKVDNTPFVKNAEYFRDALVLANTSDKELQTFKPLDDFFFMLVSSEQPEIKFKSLRNKRQ